MKKISSEIDQLPGHVQSFFLSFSELFLISPKQTVKQEQDQAVHTEAVLSRSTLFDREVF